MAFRRLCCFLASAQPCNNNNEIIILALTKKQEYVLRKTVTPFRVPILLACMHSQLSSLPGTEFTIADRDPILTAYLDEGLSRPKRCGRSLVGEGNWTTYDYDGDI
jgi:hypothetical protein